MLRYQKISEGIDINKANASKECEVCHYWFFKDSRFKFQEHVCNKCHDLLTTAYSFFFLSGFSFTNIHESQDRRGRGRAFL